MKAKLKYSRKYVIISVVSSYILFGFSTLWTIFSTNTCLPIKIAAGGLYVIVLFFTCFFAINRKKSGLISISRLTHGEENDYTKILTKIKKAHASIKIIAYIGESLLLSAKKDIIDAINRGVEVQIIIAKRGSILLEELWEIEGATQTGRQDDAERVIKEIAEKTKGNGCLFHHKEYNTQVRYALVAVDGKWAWWTPYHPGIRVEETSSFELSDTGYTSIINECIKHFNNLWSKLQ